MPGAYELVRPHLSAGEQLLWAGQPRQGFVLRWIDAGLIPLSLVAAAIPAYGAYQLLGDAPSYSSPTMVVMGTVTAVTLAIGLYLLIGRFLADRYYRSKLAYGVTNRRIIILRDVFGTEVVEFPLSTLRHLRLEEQRSGRGTFYLTAEEVRLTSNGLDVWHPVIGRSPQLFEIEEPRKVLGIIRRASR